MNIQNFIETYKKDLLEPTTDSNWNFEKGQKWAKLFIQKTGAFLPNVRRSYFELSNELIKDNSFKALHELFLIHGLGIFENEDENKLLVLVSNATDALLRIDNQDNLEWALNYLYVMLDIMFHDQLYKTTKEKLIQTFETLTANLEKIKSLDPDNYRCLVEQKMELIS